MCVKGLVEKEGRIDKRSMCEGDVGRRLGVGEREEIPVIVGEQSRICTYDDTVYRVHKK